MSLRPESPPPGFILPSLHSPRYTSPVNPSQTDIARPILASVHNNVHCHNLSLARRNSRPRFLLLSTANIHHHHDHFQRQPPPQNPQHRNQTPNKPSLFLTQPLPLQVLLSRQERLRFSRNRHVEARLLASELVCRPQRRRAPPTPLLRPGTQSRFVEAEP